MERKSSVFIIALILFPMLLSASWKTRIYQAYIGNNMVAGKNAMDKMESQKTNDNSYLAELVNYQYGYIGYCMGIDEDDAAEKYLALAEKNLDQLEKQAYSESVIKAYRSAFYGYKIGLSPVKAPFLGPKSIKEAEESVQSDKENPLGYLQLGNAQFHMPPLFGGSKTEAIGYFRNAEKIMEKRPDVWVNDNWNYLNLLALMGQSYEAINEFEQAEIYYRKALTSEPGFKWVKDELLPNLLKKLEK